MKKNEKYAKLKKLQRLHMRWSLNSFHLSSLESLPNRMQNWFKLLVLFISTNEVTLGYPLIE